MLQVVSSESQKDIEKRIKNLRDMYEGKEIAITGRSIIWAIDGLSLSVIPPDKGKKPCIKGKVPVGISSYNLQILDNGIKSGTICLASKMSKQKLKELESIEIQQTNSETLVEELQEYDYILHYSIESFTKEMKKQQAKNPNSSVFFKGIYKEEDYGRKRSEYLSVIKSYLSSK